MLLFRCCVFFGKVCLIAWSTAFRFSFESDVYSIFTKSVTRFTGETEETDETEEFSEGFYARRSDDLVLKSIINLIFRKRTFTYLV